MKTIYFSLILWMITFSSYSQTLTFTLNQAPCNANGVITATATGLTPPLTFTWYRSTYGVVATHSGVTTLTDVLNSYTGTPLYVYVSDTIQYAYANYAGAPPFNVNVTTVPQVCPALGSVTTTVTGGTPPYTFQYSDMLGAVVGTNSSLNLPAGMYQVLITDQAGCMYGSAYAYDTITIGQTNTYILNDILTNANCTNGSIAITSISGGTAPYSYLWSTGSVSSSILNLTSGNYSVAVSDATGCSETSSYYVPQGTYINVYTTPSPATCLNNNGSSVAFGSGGTSPYSYLWNTGVNTQAISNVASGYYNVTATDANGCTGNVYTYINSSTPITVTYSSTTSLCTSATGTATLTINGGTPPYTVNWSTFPAQTGITASNLAAGNYFFSIVDAVGCVQSGSVQLLPINQLSIVMSSTPATCIASNGSISANVTGGSSPYTFSWTGGGTASYLTGEPSGVYNVTVTDNMGCSKTKSGTINSSNPVSISLSSTPASCIFTADGSITATASGGTPPYTWAGGTNTLTGLNAGYQGFTVTDALGCTKYDYGYVGYDVSGTSCYCTITGQVYDDANNNCIQDAGEAGIPNIQIHCSGIGYTYTDVNGNYSFLVPSGTYAISENILAFYPLASCQNNSIPVTAVASAGCIQTINFANTINPIHDMKINTWDWAPPMPGFIYSQKMILNNMGTIPESAIVSGYKSDGQLNSPSFSPALTFITPMANWYTTTGGSGVTTLNPAANTSFYLNYTVPANIPLGTNIFYNDTVSYGGALSNWLNDYSPWDNVNTFSSTVVGSYDPNFKEVNPKGVGPTGKIYPKDSTLDYMVHFQNVGSYQAQNVVVLDTLDSDLDWTSLRPVYTSHPCKITMNENGVVRFEFININLPAKINNAEGSQGMLSYSIKTKKGLPYGTQFKNSASIYFDYNQPVITNTTINTLTNATGINETDVKNTGLTVYPNPANDKLFVELNNLSKGSCEMTIVDISGKKIYNAVYTSQKGKQVIEVSTSNYKTGLYFISVKNESGSQTTKFLKVD